MQFESRGPCVLGSSAFCFGLEHCLGDVVVKGVKIITVGLGKRLLLKEEVHAVLNAKASTGFPKEFEIFGACGNIFAIEEPRCVVGGMVGKAASK